MTLEDKTQTAAHRIRSSPATPTAETRLLASSAPPPPATNRDGIPRHVRKGSPEKRMEFPRRMPPPQSQSAETIAGNFRKLHCPMPGFRCAFLADPIPRAEKFKLREQPVNSLPSTSWI